MEKIEKSLAIFGVLILLVVVIVSQIDSSGWLIQALDRPNQGNYQIIHRDGRPTIVFFEQGPKILSFISYLSQGEERTWLSFLPNLSVIESQKEWFFVRSDGATIYLPRDLNYSLNAEVWLIKRIALLGAGVGMVLLFLYLHWLFQIDRKRGRWLR